MIHDVAVVFGYKANPLGRGLSVRFVCAQEFKLNVIVRCLMVTTSCVGLTPAYNMIYGINGFESQLSARLSLPLSNLSSNNKTA